MAESAQSSERYLTFRSDNRLYALPARQVSEIVRPRSLARVPQAPKCLLGLANLRGAVMPVASLRGLLGLQGAATTSASRLIVLEGGILVALEVDEVAALVSVPQSAVNTQDAKLTAAAGEQLHGVFQSNGRVVKILNVSALLDHAFRSDAAGRRSTPTTLPRADEKRTVADERRRLVTFEVADQEYALDLQAIHEIVTAPHHLTQVPGSDEAVLGVMSYREKLLPLLSLRILLGLPAAAHPRSKVMVTTVGDTLVGLVADHARSIVAVEPIRLEQAPAVLSARAGGEAQITQIYRAGVGRLISILAPERLFREDVMQKLAETNAAPNTKPADAAEDAMQDLRFLAFKLNGNEFALPIDAVDEVVRVPEQITRLPKTPEFLEGVINLRGVVLPVVDQRRRFEMPVTEGPGRRLVVVRTAQHRAGLIVDGVTEVLRCSSQAIRAAPDLTGEALGVVRSIINLEASGRMLLLLDPAELLSRAELSLLDAFGNDGAGKPKRRSRP